MDEETINLSKGASLHPILLSPLTLPFDSLDYNEKSVKYMFFFSLSAAWSFPSCLTLSHVRGVGDIVRFLTVSLKLSIIHRSSLFVFQVFLEYDLVFWL